MKKKIFILLPVLLVLLAFFLRYYLWFFLGNKSCDKRDYGKAISYYDKALNINPGFSSALLKKSFMLFFSGKNKEACECLDRLIDMNPGLRGVNVNFSIYNYKPLHIISVMGHKKMAELLIEHGADINAQGGEIYYTPVYFAMREKHMDLLVLFIEKGADIHVYDSNGKTLLHSAAGAGCKEAVELLIEKGADVNVSDSDGKTPLHYAAGGYFCESITELLIENGADVNAMDKSGETPLDIAISHDDNEVKEILVKYGGKPGKKEGGK
ncbi:MAG: ankyrin repeat domain-containing protein [Candidatus Eremiobacterota bacterium]